MVHNIIYKSDINMTEYGYIATGYTNTEISTTERYDDVLDTWVLRTPHGWGNFVMSAFTLQNLGYITTGYSYGNLVSKFDDVSNTWSSSDSSLINGRYGAGDFSLGGSGYVCGGYASTPVGNIERSDSIGRNWSNIGSLTTPRVLPTGFVNNNNGYIAAGSTPSGYTNTVERYDGSTWSNIGNISLPKAYLSSFTLGTTSYICGGIDQTETITYDTVDKFDGNVWSVAPNMLTPRYGFAAFMINNNGYAVCGSRIGVGYIRPTERFDGNVWSVKAQASEGKYSLTGFSLNIDTWCPSLLCSLNIT